ncbi:hypothetical protein K503DRAFT_504095 [Rhizopogon vinicolor AM-OR11-026]|uniref:Fe2OG dioxygenase domain-containing protein n=1 Tax=Rhizopogon vinicolor AM-OR11-026 TaxID=1314800 RepID=A0A1B7MM63_9AGAM|nr:hypothetical protein K503DRAFT_504095 [Rhizopogon vinicolor AM-OR11-026]
MPYDSESSEPENEISIFKRVRKRLEGLSNNLGYKVQTNTKLARALDQFAGSPFASSVYDWSSKWNFSIRVKGEEAGTWMNPDISVFQKHATPSPFGRGDETVIDPSYRNGTELKANELTFDEEEHRYIVSFMRGTLTSTMFVGKRLQVKLYKLAIYGEGGHFNWHRDSTHSDAHHGTALFALNTEWEGGDFMLKHGGVEVSVDMHPTSTSESRDPRPVIVAFYTDMEHKIMPVTKGVRVVLQYDVEVIGEEVAMRTQRLATGGKVCTYLKPDKTSIQAVVDEIQELHNKGTKIVAFPLFHLYRRASVKREYLKGNDSVLFDALNNHFDVSVNTVLICYDTDEGEDLVNCVAYRYSHGVVPETKKEELEDASANSEEDSSSEDGFTYRHDARGWVIKLASFHLPRASAIEKLLEQPLDWLGNESQQTETKYYGAGMFVKPKSERGSLVHVRERSDSNGDGGKEVKKMRME